MPDAMMQPLGDYEGRRLFWAAPGQFALPGLYFWDGERNVRAWPPAVLVEQDELIDRIGYTAEDGDLEATCDVIRDIAGAETNGAALAVVARFRKACRVAGARAALASRSPARAPEPKRFALLWKEITSRWYAASKAKTNSKLAAFDEGVRFAEAHHFGGKLENRPVAAYETQPDGSIIAVDPAALAHRGTAQAPEQPVHPSQALRSEPVAADEKLPVFAVLCRHKEYGDSWRVATDHIWNPNVEVVEVVRLEDARAALSNQLSGNSGEVNLIPGAALTTQAPAETPAAKTPLPSKYSDDPYFISDEEEAAMEAERAREQADASDKVDAIIEAQKFWRLVAPSGPGYPLNDELHKFARAVLATQAPAEPAASLVLDAVNAGHDLKAAIRFLQAKLAHASLGSCKCLTKTPVLAYHDDKCPWRLIGEVSIVLDRCGHALAAPTPVEPARTPISIEPCAYCAGWPDVKARHAKHLAYLWATSKRDTPRWQQLYEATEAAIDAAAAPTHVERGGLSIDDINPPPHLYALVVAAWNHSLPDLKAALAVEPGNPANQAEPVISCMGDVIGDSALHDLARRSEWCGATSKHPFTFASTNSLRRFLWEFLLATGRSRSHIGSSAHPAGAQGGEAPNPGVHSTTTATKAPGAAGDEWPGFDTAEELAKAQAAVPSDEQIIEQCKKVGVAWLPPDDDADGFVGAFDLTSIGEMRALFAALSRHHGAPVAWLCTYTPIRSNYMTETIVRGKRDWAEGENALWRETALYAGPAAWQPIETAPKDGRAVLLFIADAEHPFEDEPNSVSIGSYGVEGGPVEDPTWSFAGWSWQQDCYCRGAGTPTHWMPLPEPPSTATGSTRSAQVGSTGSVGSPEGSAGSADSDPKGDGQ